MSAALGVIAWVSLVLVVVAFCRAAKLGDAAERLADRLMGDVDDRP